MKERHSCTICILPETVPHISFDAQGVCNFCSEEKPMQIAGENTLKEILSARKGEIYDCVVPLSGGKDSTYILYYAVRVLNLKTIAVNFDSGFQADIAIQNMKHTCDVLNIPLEVYKADNKTQLAMLKEMLIISEKVASFYGFCGNCGTNIKTVAINVAKKYKVPFILWGGSISEKSEVKVTSLRIKIRNMPKRSWAELLFRFIKHYLYSIRQRVQMKVPLKYRFRPRSYIPIFSHRMPYKKTKFVSFFDYVKWDPIRMAKLLEEKVGWKYPVEREGRFDCQLHCLANHHWLQECGISADSLIYSKLIRQNLMSREDAILREKKIRETVEKESQEIIEKVGLKKYKMPSIGENV